MVIVACELVFEPSSNVESPARQSHWSIEYFDVCVDCNLRDYAASSCVGMTANPDLKEITKAWCAVVLQQVSQRAGPVCMACASMLSRVARPSVLQDSIQS